MKMKLQTVFNKLRTRLILSHALPVLVLIPILGFTLVYLLETQYVLGTLASQLTDQASLVVEFTQNDPRVWSQRTDAAASGGSSALAYRRPPDDSRQSR